MHLRRLSSYVPMLFGALLGRALPLPAQAAPGSARPAPAAPAEQQRGAPAALEQGRRYTGWLLGAELDSIVARMTPELLQAVGGRDGFLRFGASIAQLGAERAVLRETAYQLPGATEYVRVSRFERGPDTTFTVKWTWTPPPAGQTEDAIVGALVTATPAPAPSEHLDYRTRATLRLPFTAPDAAGADWYVAWGGRSVEENYHAATRDQRFAYDLLVVRGGATHAGDGRRNEDYHCFGLPIVAPAAGRVVVAVDSVADNVPGEMNRAAPPGNHVVLDHGAGEHSLLAHFRRGTVRVKAGDTVQAGQPLGECGNSGNSSEPHLHYHLQTGAAFRQGVGLPAQFVDYVADGAPVARGEPVRGQRIRPR